MYRSCDMSPANKFELIKKVPNCLGKYNRSNRGRYSFELKRYKEVTEVPVLGILQGFTVSHGRPRAVRTY